MCRTNREKLTTHIPDKRNSREVGSHHHEDEGGGSECKMSRSLLLGESGSVHAEVDDDGDQDGGGDEGESSEWGEGDGTGSGSGYRC